MEIRKLEDGSIELFGYVNISERNSKLIHENGIRFREQIKKGAWKRAIERNNDIKLLLNHSWDKIYGSTNDNLRLYEDNIGARFSIRTANEKLIKHAENGDFKGLSFAFRCNDDEYLDDKGYKLRYVKDMDVSEVSLLTVEPAYDGCLVEMRDKDGNVLETRDYKIELEEEQEIREEQDFSIIEKEIEILKLKAI
ncbi:HK97 family phage prohead protease [Clostridium perfringens]|nr:HK97 family phage prohead protease [Clostridium perfringens]